MQKNTAISYFVVLIQFAAAGYIVLSGPLFSINLFLVILQVTGLALGFWAIYEMRIGNFNITPDVVSEGRFVRKGPYRFIRHPMYTALLLVTLAMVIDLPTTLRMIAWGVMLIDLLVKINYEENRLLDHYPEYADYRAETKRLIPFLY